MINKTTLKFILGLKIKQLRSKADLSLKELAQKAGFSVSYLNEVEKGKKYPKVDKLASLAQALGIDMSELVSAKTGRNLHPLLKLLENDVVNTVPLDLFGLTEQDLMELMSVSPEKFASFVMTVLSISRSYDMKLSDLYKVALRATIESQDNYFEDIEKLAKTFVKNELEGQAPSTETLSELLVKNYGYRLDEGILTSKEQTKEVKVYSIRGKEPLLFLNKNLTERQKLFYMGKEIGHQVLPAEEEDGKLAELMHDFKVGYFSGAIMLEEKHLAQTMKNFFSKSKFDPDALLGLLKAQNVSTEVFFHRLTQVLPTHFGWKQLFFLRCNAQGGTEISEEEVVYSIAKEMHLSRLHSPHGVRMGEHYCRRWITISLIQDLRNNMKKGNSSRIAGAQISVMQESGEEYFALSIARPSRTKDGTLSCLTIGLKITEDVKKVVKFLDDSAIPKKVVSQTCQRCPISDCEQRVAPPALFEQGIRKRLKKEALEELDREYKK